MRIPEDTLILPYSINCYSFSHSFSAFPLNEEDGASFFEGRNRVSELLNSGFTEVLLPESGDTPTTVTRAMGYHSILDQEASDYTSDADDLFAPDSSQIMRKETVASSFQLIQLLKLKPFLMKSRYSHSAIQSLMVQANVFIHFALPQMVGFKRAYPGLGETEPFLSVEKTPRGDTSNVLNSGENHWINVNLISRAMFIRPHFPADSLEAEGELPAWPGLWMLNDASGRGGEGCLMGSDVRSQTHPSGPGVNLSEDTFDLKYEKLDMHT
ncbi:hypothetical protein MG293_003284 [Ovis ammon polii]|uniref:Uncharacterized protein n=1 Tax=Ovis ammon polii TaxID=230172 RepID=A0AAD4YG30_OVIAM|nr:hypothetical protein MG293_003284 [Ovis ammon polii]